MRQLSYSEISTAQTCTAKWSFAYGGQLAGSALETKAHAPRLSAGRAWGAAVAEFHANAHRKGMTIARLLAHTALQTTLARDLAEAQSSGQIVLIDSQLEDEQRLHDMLKHYMDTTTPLPNLTRLEEEIVVPIPSRTGRRGSSRYQFLFRIDGYLTDHEGEYGPAGGEWLWECKHRDSLQRVELIQRGPQYRWYSLGAAKAKHLNPVGILIDERWNQVPEPARIVKAKRKGEGIDGMIVSHATNQHITPEAYLEACGKYDVEPSLDALEHFRAIRWQQRVPIVFRPDELKNSGRELVSAAKFIRDLDSGDMEPWRNAKPTTCNSCDFKEICDSPEDDLLVDSLFNRVVPKRDRGKVAA